MKCKKTVALCMVIGLILGNYQAFAQTAEELLSRGIQLEEVKGELEKAIEVYQTIVEKFPDNRPVAAKALLHIGLCYEKLGLKQAQKTFQNVINKYPEQKDEVALAEERLMYLKVYVADISKKAEQHLKKGNELFNQWEYESAIEEYKNVIKLDPNTLLAQIFPWNGSLPETTVHPGPTVRHLHWKTIVIILLVTVDGHYILISREGTLFQDLSPVM